MRSRIYADKNIRKGSTREYFIKYSIKKKTTAISQNQKELIKKIKSQIYFSNAFARDDNLLEFSVRQATKNVAAIYKCLEMSEEILRNLKKKNERMKIQGDVRFLRK